MMYRKYLLSSETEISETEYLERDYLFKEFNKLPIETFAKMRHFQPQIGCLNCCKICSKFAGSNMNYWSLKRLKNVIAAIKHVVMQYRHEKPYVAWDRSEHRVGVVFSYLDNDIGNYQFLNEYINLVYDELGVITRISTVGFSRFNNELNLMHTKINNPEGIKKLGGVRLSFTPYEIGWQCKTFRYSRYDYIKDIANFLKIYRPYYNMVGSGNRKMCVELRYEPLVGISDVYILDMLGHRVIATNNYLFISKEINIKFSTAHIKNATNHSIELSEEPILFYEIELFADLKDELEAKKIAFKWINSNLTNNKLVECYLFKNADGEYYAINPTLTDEGNYGINIYPKTDSRTISGYVITERFLLNAIFSFKRDIGIGRREEYNAATWTDVYEVLTMVEKNAKDYEKRGKIDKTEYIRNKLLPLVNAYVSALQEADYPASAFFDHNFSIDTGIICNLGRAFSEFKGLTSKENEPLTPTHERNYGTYNSTMVIENIAWRLSADYRDSITIEELKLSNTAKEGGQVSFKMNIKLNTTEDYTFDTRDLDSKYLVPGQRK